MEARSQHTRLIIACYTLLLAMCLPTLAQDDSSEKVDAEAQAELWRGEFNTAMQAKEFTKAVGFGEKLLRYRRELYNAKDYPAGHPKLSSCLHSLAYCYRQLGQEKQSMDLYLDLLAVTKLAYPKDKYPQGHPELAQATYNVAVSYREYGRWELALPYFESYLEQQSAIYPESKYPAGHPQVVIAFNNLGQAYKELGRNVQAKLCYEKSYEQAVALFPKERYPQGHPFLMIVYGNLATAAKSSGEYARSVELYKASAKMAEQLYPIDRYPHGTPPLRVALINLATMLQDNGEHRQALEITERVHKMAEADYKADPNPSKRFQLTFTFQLMGQIHRSLGDTDTCIKMHENAVNIRRALLGPERSKSSSDLALVLNNMGGILMQLKDTKRARPYLEEALQICKAKYEGAETPIAHRDLSRAYDNLGYLHVLDKDYETGSELLAKGTKILDQVYPRDGEDQHIDWSHHYDLLGATEFLRGNDEGAQSQFLSATAVENSFVRTLISWLSEAEALNMIRANASTPGDLLTTTLATQKQVEETYEIVLFRRGIVQRMSWLRQQQLARALGPDQQQVYAAYLDIRRSISGLMVQSANATRAGQLELAKLTREKEAFEQDLAKLLPELQRLWEDQSQLRLVDLQGSLQPDEVFLDFVKFRQRQRTGISSRHYAAFVMTSDSLQLVDLAAADVVEPLVRKWREEIVAERVSGVARKLREAIWSPLRRKIPDGVQQIFICPDAALTQVPWAALPGDEANRVLLEDYLICTVTSGHQLVVERMKQDSDKVRVLAIGDVAYQSDQTATGDDRRADEVGGDSIKWANLPGTRVELNEIVKLAEPRKVETLSGDEARPAQVLARLSSANVAHFATHGFFAAPHYHSTLKVAASAGDNLRDKMRTAEFALRSPLALSAIVLSSDKQSKQATMLSGEAVAAMNLSGLRLVVLSACDTGLGEVADGEGVFGLQRAFHIAGAGNVVASLWRVDDASTTALMKLFYYHLWHRGKSPAEALRAAQLAIYRNPDKIDQVARADRGPAFDQVVKLVSPIRRTQTSVPVRRWAGFSLSGRGQR